MAMNNPYSRYKEQTINTATKEELTLMLYDGCIKFINIAIASLEEDNFQLANTNIIKAENIISEFMLTLNMDIEISSNLYAIYEYLNNRLIEANIQKNKDILEEVKGFIIELRDTWKEAMKLSRMGK